MVRLLQNEACLDLVGLAREIDSHRGWWRFPEEGEVMGFMGTGSAFFVGDQPSQSQWGDGHPSRRAFYGTLSKVGAQNSHLTDVYKQRGPCSGLRRGLPRDFDSHLRFFRRELDLLKPNKVIAVGWLAYELLYEFFTDVRPILGKVWHFSYVARIGNSTAYEAQMRAALRFAPRK